MHTKFVASGVIVLLTVAAGATASKALAGSGAATEPVAPILAQQLPSAQPSAGRLAPLGALGATSGPAFGFPADVLLLPDGLYLPRGATVHATSTTTNGGHTQLTYDATVVRSCTALLTDLRSWFTGGGFTETATRETPSGADLSFSRNDGDVAVAMTAHGDGCRLTEFGVLTPGAGARR